MRSKSCLIGFAFLTAGVIGGVSHAADLWSERVLQSHVDQKKLTGPLDKVQLDTLAKTGEHLFTAKFTKPDGAGRPMATQAILPTKRKRPVELAFQRIPGPDANACSSCHNDPIVGGAGHITANVFVSEGFTNPDFDTTDPQFSNERNTNHLMGSGLVELLAREMTDDLIRLRQNALLTARQSNSETTVELIAKGVQFGEITAHPDGLVDLEKIEGVDTDLVIRPFSQKGVFTSLRQFTVNALNHHHGIQATERFGERWTGENDFDGDTIVDEVRDGDISALVAWQATLKPPVQTVPENEQWAMAAKRGEKLFSDIGCATCHVPALPLDSLVFNDPGPRDAAGTLRSGDVEKGAQYDLSLFEWAKALPRNDKGQIMVPLFGDLKRHKMTDKQVATLGNELLSQRFVDRDVFQTTELWGVGSTAPYGHRGEMTTLDEVIKAHGGDARSSRDGYVSADQQSRSDMIAYLKTLVIQP